MHTPPNAESSSAGFMGDSDAGAHLDAVSALSKAGYHGLQLTAAAGAGLSGGSAPAVQQAMRKGGQADLCSPYVPCTVDLSRTRLCSLPVMIFICRCRCELTHAETSAQEV